MLCCTVLCCIELHTMYYMQYIVLYCIMVVFTISLDLLTQDLYLKLQAKPCLKTKPETGNIHGPLPLEHVK